MEYIARAMGYDIVALKFERMGMAAIEAKPAMEEVADLMLVAIGETFQSQGRRGGGSWRQDTDEWLKRKLRENLDPRIGHATLALRRAFSIRDAEHQELLVTHNSVLLNSDLPYADTEQRHRPFIKYTVNDLLKFRRTIHEWLMAAYRNS